MTRKIPQRPPEVDHTRVIERPDGYYWQATDTGEEYGPFDTLDEAVADMQAAETDFEPSETLEEAEAELGVAEWIDPDTGEPAEESVPRIEDH
ncbi:MAG TPA: hypothetical protein VEH51_00715 [Burkholderiales bacterium]|nr:hypothetical protein [Burkholderiales bacterium]